MCVCIMGDDVFTSKKPKQYICDRSKLSFSSEINNLVALPTATCGYMLYEACGVLSKINLCAC